MTALKELLKSLENSASVLRGRIPQRHPNTFFLYLEQTYLLRKF